MEEPMDDTKPRDSKFIEAAERIAKEQEAALKKPVFSWSDPGKVCQGCGRKFCLGCWATRDE